MELGLFDEAAEALRALSPNELGDLHTRARPLRIESVVRAGRSADKEHYEAQVIGAEGVKGAKVLAIELGFHAEHAWRGRRQRRSHGPDWSPPAPSRSARSVPPR